MVADDAGDDRVEAVVAGQLDELAEQEPPDPLAPEVAPDVDRVLDRRRVRGPRPVRRSATRSRPTVAVVVDRDDRRVTAGMLVDPGELLGEGTGTRSKVTVDSSTSTL